MAAAPALAGSASNSTLVIMDGLRLVGGGTQYSQTDPNIIPTSAIQRVEVLADGASSVYGSDAVAGVVNVLLDRQFTGIKAQVDFGRTFHGDGNTRHVSIGAGTGFADGRGHLVVGAEYQDTGGIGGCAEVRTCVTVPGAESTRSVHSV